jgi:hypothetical protein
MIRLSQFFGLPDRVESTTRSILVPIDEMGKDAAHALKMMTIEELEAMARDDRPNARLITRSLVPTDLGLTNNRWTETSGASNTYTTTSISNNTIADDRYVAIWGVRLFTPMTTVDNNVSLAAMEQQQYPIGQLRIIVGGARIAQWDLYPLMRVQIDLAESHAYRPISGLTLSPVLIGPNMVLQVDEYNTDGTTLYTLGFEGATTELEGMTLRP